MVLGVSRRAHRSFVAAAHIRHLSNKEAIPQTKLLLPSFHTAASHENDLLQMLVGNLENLPTILYVQNIELKMATLGRQPFKRTAKRRMANRSKMRASRNPANMDNKSALAPLRPSNVVDFGLV